MPKNKQPSLPSRQTSLGLLHYDESVYRTILQTSIDGFWISDFSGRILDINETGCQMLGYSRDDLLSMSVSDIEASETPEETTAHIQRVMAVGKDRFHSRHRRKDGTIIDVELSVQYVAELGDRLFVFVRDITERKKAEVALKQGEEKFRQLFESESDAIFLIDDETGQIYEANSAAAKSYGYTHEELLTKRNMDMSAEPDETRKATEGKAIFVPIRWHRKKDGTIFPVEISANRLMWNNRPAHIAAIRDITEREKAESEIRLLAQALASTKDCVSIADLDDKLIFVNDAFLRTYLYSREELLGQPVSIVRSANTSREIGNQILAGTLAGGWYGEILNRRKDGSDFPVELWTSVVKDHNSMVVATIGVARETTERNRSEEALRHAQKSQSIGTLAGGIAHDFNNLLNVVIGQSILALDKLPADGLAGNKISKAIKAAERAADLTRQLLAYSGKGKFLVEEIDLNFVANENVQLFETSAPRTAQLRFELGSPSPRIRGDVGQIQQVIMNLIINAGEAMGSNPGYITLRTSQIELTGLDAGYWKYTHTPLAPGVYALLQISDNGCGMNSEQMERIFDPFFTTKFTGRGLGLAAVLGIIRGHHGGIRIQSTEGKGTQFDLVFPLVESEETVKVQKAQDVIIVDGRDKTVLLIDDDLEVLDLLSDIFTEANFTLLTASNPLEGLELYRQNRDSIAAVILDYSMPGMDGKTAFEELMKINKDVKVLLCSGYMEDDLMSAFDGIQPNGFIHKPYKPATLLERVSRMISVSE